MALLSGQRVLVTGPAGQIAFPLAEFLARDNEVWGIARFGDPQGRERCEKAGIRTRIVDLAAPDWSDLPEQFDYVLHLAIFQQPGYDFDRALRVNAEGTGLLMSRFRRAKACLVMSTCSVYLPPEDPHHLVLETDPLGTIEQPFSPTYPASKIAQEGVARMAAREWELPTTIARMNVSYGTNGGLPAMQVDLLLANQPIDLVAGRESLTSPIHQDDINEQTAGLLAAASAPATVVNWGGDEGCGVREYCDYLGERVGKRPVYREVEIGITHTVTENTLRKQLVGDCRVGWRDGMRRMVEARYSDLAR